MRPVAPQSRCLTVPDHTRAVRGTATTSFSSWETTRFSGFPPQVARHHRSRPQAPRAQSEQTQHPSSFRMAGDFYTRFGAVAGGGIYVGSLDSGEATKLLDDAVLPTYADGFLVFGRDNTLFAQRFDPDRQQLSGDAVPLVHQLQMGGAPSNRATYAVSESGVLAYQGAIGEQSTLVLLD